MDYCYTCRRILNGALTCPGCGAYAPDIDPALVGSLREDPYVPGYPAGGPAPLPPANPVAPSRFSAPEPEPEPAPEPVLGPASIAPTLHRGRAARRRQMARWKKTRRRAGIATAVALFGGGVTVASMSHSGRGTTASAATHNTGSGPLGTDDSSVTTAKEQSVPGGNALHTASTPKHRAPAHAAPAVLPTQDGTDGGGSVPIAAAPASARHAAPSVTTAPQTTATTPPAATGTGGTSGTGSGGTTTTAPPASTAPSTPPPATTSPTTPPSQHGLCVLILCIG